MPNASPQAAAPARLDHLACLRVSGADARTFLQGQLSADLRTLDAGRARWASYNSAKGRMLAVALLVADGDAVEMWMPRSLLDPVTKRLRMFVLRSKVTLDAADAAPRAFGLTGADAAAALRARSLPVPSAPMQVCRHEALRIVRMPDDDARFLLLAGDDAAAQALGAATAQPGDADWQRANILGGVPVVYAETQDRWVAQMANLDLLDGISFDKGCYTGQEVIARLHYLGNLKKRLYRVRGSGPAPAAGSAIHDGAGDAQAVGEIVDACADGAGFVASAVLQIAAETAATLAVNGAPLARPEAYRYAGPAPQ